MQSIQVGLNRNGRSWLAVWVNPQSGKRERKSLGLIKDHPKNGTDGITKRQAETERANLAFTLSRTPALSGQAPTLAEFCQQYLASRSDLKPSTKYLHTLTTRYLRSHFGDTLSISKITRASAAEWRSKMAAGSIVPVDCKDEREQRPLSEQAVGMHVRVAKVIFASAVDSDLILLNPFDRLRGFAEAPMKDWAYVDAATFQKINDACPSTAWRLLFNLCRWAGLRKSEALGLKWKHIDLSPNRPTLTVYSGKTNRRRSIPICPTLSQALQEAKQTAKGEWAVCRSQVQPASVSGRVRKILKAAGLSYAKPLHTLRKNCATDWSKAAGPYAAAEWLRHSMQVAADHYIQVTDDLWAKVTGSPKSTITISAFSGEPSTVDPSGFVKQLSNGGWFTFGWSDVNPCHYLVEPTGIEPATPSLQS